MSKHEHPRPSTQPRSAASSRMMRSSASTASRSACSNGSKPGYRDISRIPMSLPALHVVTAIANPIRWGSRIGALRRSSAHARRRRASHHRRMRLWRRGPLELAGNRRRACAGARRKTLVWTKENLLNIGLARLPEDWKYVAWIDADIAFRQPGWAAETVQALQHYDVVQPWTRLLRPRAARRAPAGASQLLPAVDVTSQHREARQRLHASPIRAMPGPRRGGRSSISAG